MWGHKWNNEWSTSNNSKQNLFEHIPLTDNQFEENFNSSDILDLDNNILTLDLTGYANGFADVTIAVVDREIVEEGLTTTQSFDVIIDQYNNRINQIKIGAINSIIMSVTIAIILYELFYKEVMIKNTFDVNILISFYLIFTALIFNSIANRFIKKDEILVNESNRIR